jgi:hypothetical protein
MFELLLIQLCITLTGIYIPILFMFILHLFAIEYQNINSVTSVMSKNLVVNYLYKELNSGKNTVVRG